jgi:hypothetical protein
MDEARTPVHVNVEGTVTPPPLAAIVALETAVMRPLASNVTTGTTVALPKELAVTTLERVVAMGKLPVPVTSPVKVPLDVVAMEVVPEPETGPVSVIVWFALMYPGFVKVKCDPDVPLPPNGESAETAVNAPRLAAVTTPCNVTLEGLSVMYAVALPWAVSVNVAPLKSRTAVGLEMTVLNPAAEPVVTAREDDPPPPAGVAHVASPRQNVEPEAEVPLLRFVTGRFPTTCDDKLTLWTLTGMEVVPDPLAFPVKVID